MRENKGAPRTMDSANSRRPRRDADGDASRHAIKAFLIADIRGYTGFTDERGDEAAADLASRFAEIVRQQVEASGGTLVELRGDEALVVFVSPRDAIRAAVELQSRLLENRPTG